MRKKRKIAATFIIVLAIGVCKSVGYTEEILNVEEIVEVPEETVWASTENSETEIYLEEMEEIFEADEEVILDVSDGQLLETATNLDTEESMVQMGECGENGSLVIWELDSKGTLWIRGTGEMKNWNTPGESPWSEYLDSILRIVVEEGVTSVGDYAFCGGTLIKDIELADSVKYVGEYAFSSCSSLTEVRIG